MSIRPPFSLTKSILISYSDLFLRSNLEANVAPLFDDSLTICWISVDFHKTSHIILQSNSVTLWQPMMKKGYCTVKPWFIRIQKTWTICVLVKRFLSKAMYRKSLSECISGFLKGFEFSYVSNTHCEFVLCPLVVINNS